MQVAEVIKKRYGDEAGSPPVFFYHNNNQDKTPTEEWDLYLGNLGLVPTYVEKWIKDITDEEKQNTIKYVIADLAQAVMKTNKEIWKHRCKILYAQNPKDPT